VQGAGCWALGVGCWALGVGCWVSGVGCLVLSFGFWVLGVGCWVFGVGSCLEHLGFKGGGRAYGITPDPARDNLSTRFTLLPPALTRSFGCHSKLLRRTIQITMALIKLCHALRARDQRVVSVTPDPAREKLSTRLMLLPPALTCDSVVEAEDDMRFMKSSEVTLLWFRVQGLGFRV